MTQSKTKPTPDQVAEFVRSIFDDKDQDDIETLNLSELRTRLKENEAGISEFIDHLVEALVSSYGPGEAKLLVDRLN